jgi:putative PIG3 family NAD(P)H quinone oxidoreductase
LLAVTLKNFGPPDVLTVTEVPTPKPSSEQLLVKVHAAGLNRADLLQRRGKYAPPKGESDILGLEIAGVVVEVGSDVNNYKIGDRVFGLVGGGAYAQYCVIDHEVAMPIPNELSYIEAAGVAEAFLTACEAIFTLGNLQNNESILIHAGGSGVGTAGIQLANQVTSQIFTTVGSAEKKEKLKSFPVKKIIDYKNEDFEKEILEITNHKGVDVIIDFIGASYLMKNLNSLSVAGRLICVGLMGGSKTEIDLNVLQTKRLQIKGLRMRTRSLDDKRKMAKNFVQKWLPLFVNQKMRPVIDSVFAMKDVVAAHEYMEGNGNFGKIVLEI